MSRHEDPRHPDRSGPTLEVLAESARAWADQPPRAPAISRWPSLERSLETATRRRARRRPVLFGATAVGMAMVVALVLGGVRARRQAPAPAGGAPLSFTFTGSPKATGESLQAGAGTGHARFSDGSDVALEPEARVRVLATNPSGARVRLDSGRARFVVAHHARVDWVVEAGPFQVIVHGTTFLLDWSPAEGHFAIDLTAGRVSITGPLSGGNALTLEAGRRLTAGADGSFRVSRLDETEGEGASAAPRTAAAAVAVAAPTVAAAPAEAPSPKATSPRSQPPSQPPSQPRSEHHRSHGPAIGTTWPARVASGQFESVLDEVSALGIERAVDGSGVSALVALADAARYGGRTDYAKKALLAQRRRFARSSEARDAAFLLGRLSEDVEHDLPGALAWYVRYLDENDAAGSYGSEALGRQMLALDRLGQPEEATQAARLYLDRFPLGPYAAQAARRAR